MSKKIALLSIGDIITSDDLDITRSDQLQADINGVYGETETASSVIQNAEDIAHHLDAQKKIIDDKAGVTEEDIQFATESIKLASKLTGNEFKRVKASLESAGVSKEEISKELGLAVQTLNKQISVAQEGFIDKLSYNVGNIFVSINSMQERAYAASDKEPKQQQILKKPAFSKHITVRKNPQLVTGLDTLASIKEVFAAIDNKEVERLITEFTKLARELGFELKKSTFIYSKEQKEKMANIVNRAMEISDNMKSFVKERDTYVDAETMDRSELKKVSELIQHTQSNRDSAGKKLDYLHDLYIDNFSSNANKNMLLSGGIIGAINENSPAQVMFKDFMRYFDKFYELVAGIFYQVNNIAYAAVRHMEASVMK